MNVEIEMKNGVIRETAKKIRIHWQTFLENSNEATLTSIIKNETIEGLLKHNTQKRQWINPLRTILVSEVYISPGVAARLDPHLVLGVKLRYRPHIAKSGQSQTSYWE